MINTLKIISAVIIIFILVITAADHANFIKKSPVFQQLHYNHNKEVLEICKSYRDFQKSVEGQNTVVLDSVCNDVENEINKIN